MLEHSSCSVEAQEHMLAYRRAVESMFVLFVQKESPLNWALAKICHAMHEYYHNMSIFLEA